MFKKIRLIQTSSNNEYTTQLLPTLQAQPQSQAQAAEERACIILQEVMHDEEQAEPNLMEFLACLRASHRTAE